MSSKSVEQAVEIQTGFAKRAYDDYMQQMSKIGGMYAAMAKEAYKPVEKMLQNGALSRRQRPLGCGNENKGPARAGPFLCPLASPSYASGLLEAALYQSASGPLGKSGADFSPICSDGRRCVSLGIAKRERSCSRAGRRECATLGRTWH